MAARQLSLQQNVFQSPPQKKKHSLYLLVEST